MIGGMSKRERIFKTAKLLAEICGTWWAIMSGAISIPLAFIALLLPGNERKIFAVLAFCALWALVIRMGWKNYQLLEKQKPKFKLACSKDIPGCTAPNHDHTWTYLRILATTETIVGIEGCLVHLTKIEKDGVVVFDHESRELPFAPSEDADSLAKTLSHGVQYYLDVFGIHWPRSTIFIAAANGRTIFEKNKNGQYIFQDNGEYIVTVNVSGKNTPAVEMKLKLNWTRNPITTVLDAI